MTASMRTLLSSAFCSNLSG